MPLQFAPTLLPRYSECAVLLLIVGARRLPATRSVRLDRRNHAGPVVDERQAAQDMLPDHHPVTNEATADIPKQSR
jgi:hypothetical protein